MVSWDSPYFIDNILPIRTSQTIDSHTRRLCTRQGAFFITGERSAGSEGSIEKTFLRALDESDVSIIANTFTVFPPGCLPSLPPTLFTRGFSVVKCAPLVTFSKENLKKSRRKFLF